MEDNRLRILRNESTKNGILSVNLLYCCIAKLNDYINSSDKEQRTYKEMREKLASVALHELNVDKLVLANSIKKLSSTCYASMAEIRRVAEMIDGSYTVDNSFIPNELMIYVSEEDVSTLTELPPPKQRVFVLKGEEFAELCTFIEDNYDVNLSEPLQKKLIKSYEEYSVDVAFKAVQWKKNEFLSSMRMTTFNSNEHKCRYLFGCIKNSLEDVAHEIQIREYRQNLAKEAADLFMKEREGYYGKSAEYKPKQKKNNKRFDDLW